MPTIKKDKKNKPKKESASEDRYVSYWKPRLRRAEKKLKEKGGDVRKSGEWGKLIRLYEGDQWPELTKSKGKFHRVTSNQVKANIDSIRPQLYFQNPKVRIQIKNPSITPTAIPEMQTVTVVDPATGMPQQVQQPVIGQDGQPVVKIPAGAPVATINGQMVNAHEQCELLESIDNYYLTECKCKLKFRRIINDALILPYGVSKWEWVVEIGKQPDENGKEVDAVLSQYPVFTRVPPWLFLWDADLEEFDFDKSRWVAEIQLLTREDIEADPRIDVNLDSIPDEDLYEDDSEDEDSCSRYKVYHIHDLEHDEFLIWVEGSDKINRRESPNMYSAVEGSIYTVLGFDELPDDSFPMAIPKQIKSKVEAYNWVLSYAVNHIQRFNRKYRMLKGTVSPDQKELLEAGADGTIVEVESMNGGPDPINDAPISNDIYQVGQILKREITEDIGVTAYDRGTRETGVDTAYEANLIQGGADIKVQEKRDVVLEFVKTNVKKLNQILKEFADTKTVTEIAGPKGSKWVEWSNADITGEFIEDVDIYNALPYARETEKKQAMELVSIANQNPYVNQTRLWERVFRAFEWGNELLATPEEMAQQQQMQQQQQQAEEAKRQAGQTMKPGEGGARPMNGMQGAIMGGSNKPRQG